MNLLISFNLLVHLETWMSKPRSLSPVGLVARLVWANTPGWWTYPLSWSWSLRLVAKQLAQHSCLIELEPRILLGRFLSRILHLQLGLRSPRHPLSTSWTRKYEPKNSFCLPLGSWSKSGSNWESAYSRRRWLPCLSHLEVLLSIGVEILEEYAEGGVEVIFQDVRPVWPESI